MEPAFGLICMIAEFRLGVEPRNGTQNANVEQKGHVVEVRWNPESLLIFTSACPLKVQITQGLGTFVQIGLLTTGLLLTRVWLLFC